MFFNYFNYFKENHFLNFAAFISSVIYNFFLLNASFTKPIPICVIIKQQFSFFSRISQTLKLVKKLLKYVV